MGAQGTTTIDFGAFPGASDATATVTGQGSILSGSLVEAWIFPTATGDHTADEHMIETIRVVAGTVVAGVGFTIRGFNTNQLIENPPDSGGQTVTLSKIGGTGTVRPNYQPTGQGTRLWGTWTVAWVWN